MSAWENDGWWRVLDASGGPWMETSDEAEARKELNDAPGGGKLQYHQRKVEQRWVTAP